MKNFFDWIKENPGKFVALSISFSYILYFYLTGGTVGIIRILGALVLALACIFFGEEMGGYIGPSGGQTHEITRKTPGCIVTYLGWIFLLTPMIIFAVNTLRRGFRNVSF